MKNINNILVCLADELFQEACEQSYSGNYEYSFEEIKEKALKEFNVNLTEEQCFKIMELIFDFNKDYLLYYPEFNNEGFDLGIGLERVRGKINEDFLNEEGLEDYFKKEEWINNYLKEHKDQYGEDYVYANGEWYETLSLKQSERIFQSYALWLYDLERKQKCTNITKE